MGFLEESLGVLQVREDAAVVVFLDGSAVFTVPLGDASGVARFLEDLQFWEDVIMFLEGLSGVTWL